NYLCVSPRLAEARKLREGQVVQLTVGTKSVHVPVHIQPGQDDNALGLALGYGRTDAGRVANNVGVNAYQFVHFTKGSEGFRASTGYTALAATITPTATRVPLANVAGHNSMEGRQIVVEATL